MNTSRILQAVNDIEKNTAALSWLETYGKQMSARDRDQASVNVHLSFGGACVGAKEAQEVLSSFARLSLPDLIEQSIRNCRNTIQLAQAAIRDEAAF